MGVVARETAVRCKLCQHHRRQDIDALLEMRSKRQQLDGQTVNLAYVRAQLAEWGVDNPTEENVKNHWQKHCEVVSEEAMVERRNRVKEIIDRVLGVGWENRIVTPDEYNAVIPQLSLHGLVDQGAGGKGLGITPDHALKAISESTRRVKDEATADLFRALGGAVQASMAGLSTPNAPELPAGDDVIEGEYVEAES